MIHLAGVASLLVASFVLPHLAVADADLPSDRPVIGDTFVIRAGTFVTDFSTTANIGSGKVLGTSIELEDQLNVDENQSVFRLDGFYRFNERHAIGFGYWSFRRDGTTTLDEDIEYDGDLFSVGAEVQSTFDTQWIRAEWRYTLFGTDKGEAGFNVGLSIYDFDTAIEGEATVSDGMGMMTTEFVESSEGFVAPIPTVGVFVNFTLSKRWLFSFRTDYFDLEYDDLSGNLLDTTVSFDYFFTEKLGLGVGSNTVDIDVRDGGDDPFRVSYRQSSVYLYLTFAI